MKSIPEIRGVMTGSPRSIELDAPVREAEDLMVDHEIRHLVVTEGGELVGMVSDRDIAFASNAPAESLRDQLRVRDVCSLEVYAVESDTPLDRVLVEMAERRIGSAVVTDGGKIAGLFTATDACRVFAQFLRD